MELQTFNRDNIDEFLEIHKKCVKISDNIVGKPLTTQLGCFENKTLSVDEKLIKKYMNFSGYVPSNGVDVMLYVENKAPISIEKLLEFYSNGKIFTKDREYIGYVLTWDKYRHNIYTLINDLTCLLNDKGIKFDIEYN